MMYITGTKHQADLTYLGAGTQVMYCVASSGSAIEGGGAEYIRITIEKGRGQRGNYTK